MASTGKSKSYSSVWNYFKVTENDTSKAVCIWLVLSLMLIFRKSGSGSGRIWIHKSGQIRLRPDLENWNPVHPKDKMSQSAVTQSKHTRLQ